MGPETAFLLLIFVHNAAEYFPFIQRGEMGPETAAKENLLNKYFCYGKNGHSLTVI